MSSLSRFEKFMPGMRTNVVEYGATVQEYELTKGDPDPEVQPLANTAPTNRLLGLSTDRTSDRLRLGDPNPGLHNDFEGPVPTWKAVRSTLQRLESKLLNQLLVIVRDQGGELSQRQEDSLSRVFRASRSLRKLYSYMSHINLERVRSASA